MKVHLRTHIKGILRSLPRDKFEEANLKLRDMVVSDPRWEFVTRVCSYASFKTELPTSALNIEVVNTGRGLFLPEVTPEKSLVMKPANDFLERRGLTLVLVPGLAFSSEGDRLGRGWGCYDRFIRETRQDPSIIFTGVCFRCQLFESIPQDSWDVRLQEVLVI
jgi:5-formyltetrahydrofolate cyclo-ligase